MDLFPFLDQAIWSRTLFGVPARMLLGAVVVLLALDTFGVEVAALVAGLGIAVALAVQNMDIQQAINLALHRRFAAAGIAFAYPAQTLFLRPVPAEPNGAVPG
jgi:small-conductance mechanosensitive channel